MALVPATTPARVRALMGGEVASSGSSLDALLTELIKAVTVEIEAFLGYPLELAERTEEYSVGPGAQILLLRVQPVTGVSSVKEDETWGFGASTALSSSDYRLDREAATLHFASRLRGGARAVQVVYTAGLGATTADIIANAPWVAMACDLQVYADFRRKGLTTTKSRGGPNGGITLTDHQLLGRVQQMLRGHQRLPAGVA